MTIHMQLYEAVNEKNYKKAKRLLNAGADPKFSYNEEVRKSTRPDL